MVREYIGGGVLGEIATLEDELKRRQREEEAAFWKEEKERLEKNATFLKELEETAEIIVRAGLVVAGCHKHKGEWRRERERNT